MSGPTEKCIALDGLPARKSGPWAQEKLHHLSRYAGIMTTAMKGKWKRLVFVDLMAGPGKCVDKLSPGWPEFDGSTLLALDQGFPFSTVVSVEKKPANAAALRARVAALPRADRAIVLEADCNSDEVVNRVRAETAHALSLMFVDLIGTEVRMRTIRRIAANRKVDLVITWPVMDMNRNRGMLTENPERVDEFFGTQDWRHVVENVGPHRIVPALQRLYIRQLEAIGYTHHQVLRGVRNQRGGVLYRQMFASKNPLGLKLWNATTEGQTRQNPMLF